MDAPGSGTPPKLFGLTSTCTPSGSQLTFTCNKAISGSVCGVELQELDGTSVWGGTVGASLNAKTFTIDGTLDGSYKLVADNGEATAELDVVVACGNAGGNGCDLVLVSATPYPPTSPGGFGYVAIVYTSSNPAPVSMSAVNLTLFTGHDAPAPGFTGGSGHLTNLLPGSYSFNLRQGDTCSTTGTFVLKEAASPPDPSLGKPARWEPVGGVLPNPVLLAIEASLTTRAGLPRPGLHAELELWRPAATAAFASFRATVRTASQQVDAAPYLRAQLVALPRYSAAASQPFVDADAALRFTYRFRVVDSDNAEPWQSRAGERYAVLAALAGATDTMAPYVADGTGRVASIFPDGEGCQFVGLPLEASVLLPPATGQPRWAELRYVDALGAAVEIRTYPLADSLPAGMLRIPLPPDPPLCATAVEVSVRDDNRAFVGTCGYVLPPVPTSTRGTYADPIYGFY